VGDTDPFVVHVLKFPVAVWVDDLESPCHGFPPTLRGDKGPAVPRIFSRYSWTFLLLALFKGLAYHELELAGSGPRREENV
jgi:hypothetical protein